MFKPTCFEGFSEFVIRSNLNPSKAKEKRVVAATHNPSFTKHRALFFIPPNFLSIHRSQRACSSTKNSLTAKSFRFLKSADVLGFLGFPAWGGWYLKRWSSNTSFPGQLPYPAVKCSALHSN